MAHALPVCYSGLLNGGVIFGNRGLRFKGERPDARRTDRKEMATARDLENRANRSPPTATAPHRVAVRQFRSSGPAWSAPRHPLSPSSVLRRIAAGSVCGNSRRRPGARRTDGISDPGFIVLAGTRRGSGIVRAMLPSTTLNRSAAPSARTARLRPGDDGGGFFRRPGRTGRSTTQEEMHGFDAAPSFSGIRASLPTPYPTPASDAAAGSADRNHTVNTKMLSALFSVPSSGRYPLASYILFIAGNISIGAADACGR